ncbi:glycerol-3-phosphate responsive antiterminator [Schaalia sp. ZJ405]|uniref:glycerol-3-phosphate responsive antiterminator n=1 Tax=unclassified Schaalia TaxID=2691889 RepID=UPI0013EA446E|nr:MULTISPECIES: glycerol-3-phosphate responsive antiterminator [unclassified Schaalia]QPK81459.1 glycerol-3-phosphate responsive antiterminator [Schaalia sp. ZJ405]
MDEKLADRLRRSPVIASVKSEDDLEYALASPCRVICLLFGEISTIGALTRRVTDAGKDAFVNLDMVDGLAPRASAVRFIRDQTSATGILTSKVPVCRAASDSGLVAILRFFMVDSFAYGQVVSQSASAKAHAVEILPGCIPRVITWMRDDLSLPIIAGGLVCNITDIMDALDAGAAAIATSSKELWSVAPSA